MRRLRWRGHRTGFGVFLVGSGMGLVTNLVTADPGRWPRPLQPVATYAPAIGAGLVAAVGLKALWDAWRFGVRRPVWDGGNPYPGLAAYTQRWAGVFFGRGREAQDLLIRVRTARTPQGRFVPVVGPSGSGKSSLVLAGLLPALGDGSGFRVLPPFSPGTGAVGELGAALGRDVSAEAEAASRAASTGAPVPRLDGVLAALARARAGGRRLLMVVDQLEEAVVQCLAEDRHAFLALLEAVLDQEPRLTVVATVRSDSIGEFQQGPGSDLFRDPLMVNVMGPRELRSVVVEPARLTETTFQDGLVDEIVRDAGGGDVLPLLSYVLSDLYDRAARDRRITWGEYEASGGVSGAITRRAEAAVRELGPESLELCLDTLLLFVTLAGGGATRQRVPASALDSRQLDVVRAFVDARLLTSDSTSDGSVVYDLVHEALLRQWQPLADHISRHEERLRRRTELAPLARAWVRSGRQPDYLISGARLTEAYPDTGGLSPEVQEFLEASQRNQAGEMERRADRAAREALALLGSDPETAVSLALAAYTELSPTPTARYALEMSLASGLVHWYRHAGRVRVAFAPDGRLATVSDGDPVHVRDGTGRLLYTLGSALEWVTALAFGPDGRLAAATGDGPVRVWDAGGTPVHEVPPPDASTVGSLAYAPDGRLAVGGRSGTVRICAAGTGLVEAVLACATPVYAVAYAPDGRLAAGCADGTVRVWDAKHRLRYRLGGHDDCVFAVAFGPDGSLASGGRGGDVLVWDTAGNLADRRGGHTLRVNALAYSADGFLASGGDDASVRIWSPDGRLRHVLTEHTDGVTALAYAPDGRLATGAADGTTGVWDPGDRLIETPPTPDGEAMTLAFTPDGRLAVAADPEPISDPATATRLIATARDGRVASADPDRSVQIRDADGQVRHKLAPHGARVTSGAFAPDGRLATGSADGELRVWDTDGMVLLSVKEPNRPVRAIAFADDGRMAANCGGRVRIWPGPTVEATLLRLARRYPRKDLTDAMRERMMLAPKPADQP